MLEPITARGKESVVDDSHEDFRQQLLATLDVFSSLNVCKAWLRGYMHTVTTNHKSAIFRVIDNTLIFRYSISFFVKNGI